MRSLLGQYKKICGMHKDEPFLVLPPNKIRCITLMVLVNIVSIIMLVLLSRYQEAYVFFTVHLVILIYLDIFWLSTGLINPGIISKSGHEEYGCVYCKDNLEDYDQETQLLTIKEHCKKCQVCIEDREHHCSITGGCIGNGNKISYHFFLLGIVIYAIDFLCTAPYIYYLR